MNKNVDYLKGQILNRAVWYDDIYRLTIHIVLCCLYFILSQIAVFGEIFHLDDVCGRTLQNKTSSSCLKEELLLSHSCGLGMKSLAQTGKLYDVATNYATDWSPQGIHLTLDTISQTTSSRIMSNSTGRSTNTSLKNMTNNHKSGRS